MWWTWALGSTIFWGLFYVLVSRLSPTLSPISLYWLPNITLLAILPFTYKQIATDYANLWSSGLDIKIAAAVASIISIIASVMFYKSIGMHTATHASLIQITYPVFTAIFAFIFFSQNHFSWSVMVGGALIMIGAGIIILNNG